MSKERTVWRRRRARWRRSAPGIGLHPAHAVANHVDSWEGSYGMVGLACAAMARVWVNAAFGKRRRRSLLRCAAWAMRAAEREAGRGV